MITMKETEAANNKLCPVASIDSKFCVGSGCMAWVVTGYICDECGSEYELKPSECYACLCSGGRFPQLACATSTNTCPNPCGSVEYSGYGYCSIINNREVTT